MPLASTTDVQNRLGRDLTPTETTIATALLADAEAELRSRVPLLQERLDSGLLDPALVVRVLCAMVLRVLRNPEGLRQQSESIDDYTRSWTVDSARSAGALYLDPSEIELLLPAPAGLRVGTVQLGTYL